MKGHSHFVAKGYRMAVQSVFFTINGSTKTFPSTKHIPTKAHMAIWLKDITTQVWTELSVSKFELINNAAVLAASPSATTYDTIEVRAADEPDELLDSPTDIGIVAGMAPEIVIVAGIDTEVVTVAGMESEVRVVGSEPMITNIPLVVGNQINIDKVAAIDDDVTKVAAIDTDVSKVAAIDGDVTDVAAIDQDIVDINEPVMKQSILDAGSNATSAAAPP